MRVAAWLSPALIVMATLIGIVAAILGMWWLAAAMIIVCVVQFWTIRTRRRA